MYNKHIKWEYYDLKEFIIRRLRTLLDNDEKIIKEFKRLRQGDSFKVTFDEEVGFK